MKWLFWLQKSWRDTSWMVHFWQGRLRLRTGTCSWMKLVCDKLACIQIRYQILTTTSHYRGHLTIFQHNTNFATIHSGVTVGSSSVCKYKLLHHFAMMVEGTRCYLWLKQSNLLHGHTNHFRMHLRQEQSGSGWNPASYLQNRYKYITLQTKWKTGNFFFWGGGNVCVFL